MNLDEKDWIIVRLMRVLLQSGQFAAHSDVIKTAQWFEQANRDHGPRVHADGEVTHGPLYGTGTAKLVEGMRLVAENPVFDRDTGTWRAQ
jgi:hypothetical protein